MDARMEPDEPAGVADGPARLEAEVADGPAGLEVALATLEAALATLEVALDRLAGAARSLPDVDAPATGSWSARMVLAHVVFWHESFARNLADVVAGRRPTPLRGTYAVLGQRAQAELGHLEVEALLERAAAAQAVIRRHIGASGIVLIPYRQGSRPYAPAEHLRVTAAHVAQHAGELERSGRRTPSG